ncbi:MAG: flagellar biosynthetic protein FliO [Eubacteriales bacterium]|nr:flagellar biosynthetic protein FliO [Eubacteriales bacterium]
MTIALTAPENSSGWLQNLGALVLMVLVFALAYGGTRLLAQRPHLIRHSSQLKVIERLSLGRDRQLLLVQVGEKVYLAGVTPQHITLGEAVELPEFASVLEPLAKDRSPLDSSPSDKGSLEAPSGTTADRGVPFIHQQVDRWISQGKDLIHAACARRPSGPPDHKDT